MILLYDVTEQDFDNNGLGPLSDATSCTVTEERNGVYELKMVYPSSGPLFSELTDDRIIFCKANPYDDPEPFRIYRRTDPRNGLATIYANHISYDLSNIPISPFIATSALDAMSKMQENQAIKSPFTFWTDKTTSAEMAVSTPCSARSQLGGKTGSILDVYGGEYQFSRFLVRLYNERGTNRGVSIRYGKNLTDIEQDRNIANTYTGVYPYWVDNEGNLVELPEKIIYAEGNYSMQKVRPLDLSQNFETAPSASELREAAQSYIQSNNIGVPVVSITIDFIALDQTEEYKDMPLLESVRLCDTVNVEFPKLGISAQAKCIKTEYDVLKGRYSSIQLGEARSSISDTISDQQQEIQNKPSESMMQKAISELTAAILGAQGGSVRLLDTNGDGEPDTLYIADNPDPAQAVKVWRFNYEGWGASENGYNGPFRLGASLDHGIVADFITTGTLQANLIKAGIIKSVNGRAYFDLNNGTLQATKLITQNSKDTTTTLTLSQVQSGYLPGLTLTANNKVVFSISPAVTGGFQIVGNDGSSLLVNETQMYVADPDGNIIANFQKSMGSMASSINSSLIVDGNLIADSVEPKNGYSGSFSTGSRTVTVSRGIITRVS